MDSPSVSNAEALYYNTIKYRIGGLHAKPLKNILFLKFTLTLKVTGSDLLKPAGILICALIIGDIFLDISHICLEIRKDTPFIGDVYNLIDM